MDTLYNKISFKTSRIITKNYSTSFYTAVSMLAPELRSAIHGIYGFVRLADEIVDTFLESDQEHLINKFEEELKYALKNGISMNPALHSFVLTVRKYQIPELHIYAFLKSMRADLRKNIYDNSAETSEYIYGSAEVVGLMCLKVFVEGNPEKYAELEESARKLGSAFQKVNFLRDLKADTVELNRTYFAEMKHNEFNEEVKTKLIKEIEFEFKEARKGILKLPNTSKIAVYLAFLYYNKLLRKLKKTPAKRILSARVRVNNTTKFALYFKAYTSYKLNLI